MDAINLTIGSTFYLQRALDEEVTEVMALRLAGYVTPRSLILVPADEGAEPRLEEGEEYIARLIQGDNRYAFRTRLLTTIRQPYLHYHLDYPQGVQGVMRRRAPRFAVNIPIHLSLQQADHTLKVMMKDISVQGACLVTDEVLGRSGDGLNIEFRLPSDQSLINLHARIRYMYRDSGAKETSYYHGVEFVFDDEQAQIQIEGFIEALILAQRQPCLQEEVE